MDAFEYSPLEKPSNIRLLWLEPGETHEQLILLLFEASRPTKGSICACQSQVKLTTSEASPDYTHYHALSYVWGDANDPAPIRVDHAGFDVTSNLHQFLEQARHAKERRGPYWVDALSKNQRDNQEKNFQVAMMSDTYSQTCQCIVWLGQEYDDSNLAFDLIEDVDQMVQLF